MSYFRFNTFPRPPRWGAAMMMGGGPRPAPEPPKEPEQIPFIPPDLSGSLKEYEDEDEDEEQEEEQHEHHEHREHHEHLEHREHHDEHHEHREHRDREVDRERGIRGKEEEKAIKHQLIRLKAYRFRHSKNSWKHLTTYGLRMSAAMEDAERHRRGRCSEVRVITWNVDMATGQAEERLTEALRYLEHVVLKCKNDDIEPEPCVIMLQEVRNTLLPYLLRDEWVRSWFIVTPFTTDKWPQGSYYGNVTLVSRSIPIAEAHILHFGISKMQRTAVCVKIRLDVPGTHDKVVMAMVNTHLESLPIGAKARPNQLEMCARFLTLEGVSGGVVAGDMNSIGPEDATLPRAVGLKDSWRKGDDVEEGKTWGYQGQNQGNFPCGRLDKILFLRGTAGYKVEEPRPFGVGLKTRDEALWVSDHYGLETTLRVVKPRMNSS